MAVLKDFRHRTFLEVEWFNPEYREVVLNPSSNGWLNTVETGLERNRTTQEFDKNIIRIVRWAARKDNKEKEKNVWRYIKSYNIRSNEEWEKVSDIIDRLSQNGTQSPNSISMPVKELAKLFKAEDEREVYKQKLLTMRENIQHLESTLNEYSNLIFHNDTSETDVHNFLKRHKAFWMFGLEYIGIKSKVSFPPGKDYYEFDLMLQRHDDFWDLVELKGPNENLFDKRTKRRSMPNRKLSEAVGQVFTYLHAIDLAGELDIVKPKAYIVIGKADTDRTTDRRIFSSYINNVELITHSELYNRGQRLLKHIRDTSNQ
jgi:hypothetical protein